MISIQVPQVILLELKYLYHLSLRLQSEITVKIHLPSLQNTGLKWGVIPSKIKLFRQIYVESSFGWQYTGLFKKRIFNNWPNLLKNIFGLILTWTRIIIQFFVTKSGFFTPLQCASIVQLLTLKTQYNKPRYNEPRYSEFLDIVNKPQLPFWGSTKYIRFDIVNYINIVNKKGLTDLFAKSRFQCT